MNLAVFGKEGVYRTGPRTSEVRTTWSAGPHCIAYSTADCQTPFTRCNRRRNCQRNRLLVAFKRCNCRRDRWSDDRGDSCIV